MALNVQDAVPQIYPTEGGAPRAVPGALAGDLVSRFSSDGRSLYVAVRNGPRARIDRIELATGSRTVFRDLSPADRAGLIDLSYFLMTPDARTFVYSYRRYLATLYLVDGLR